MFAEVCGKERVAMKEIFTPRVREAIVKQKVADLFVNRQGVMGAKGEAWLSVSGKAPHRYGMISVNLAP